MLAGETVPSTGEAPEVVPDDLGLVPPGRATRPRDREPVHGAALCQVGTRQPTGPAVFPRTGSSGTARCGPETRGPVRGWSGADDGVATPDPFAPRRQYLSIW